MRMSNCQLNTGALAEQSLELWLVEYQGEYPYHGSSSKIPTVWNLIDRLRCAITYLAVLGVLLLLPPPQSAGKFPRYSVAQRETT